MAAPASAASSSSASSSPSTTASGNEDSFNVLLVTDATASMGTYLEALKRSSVEISSLLRVLAPQAKVAACAFRDMCDSKHGVVAPTRWFQQGDASDHQELLRFLSDLRPIGGGDYPEAAKLGLAVSLRELIRKEPANKKTIVLLYTDDAPHHGCNGDKNDVKSNMNLEREYFRSQFDKEDAKLWDWMHLSRALAGAGAVVYPIVSHTQPSVLNFYTTIAAITDGQCIQLVNGGGNNPATITETTMQVLLSALGASTTSLCSRLPESQANVLTFNANQLEFIRDVQSMPHENDALGFFRGKPTQSPLVLARATNLVMQTVANLKLSTIPRRFKADQAFANVVFDVLKRLLTVNHCMSLLTNPVFGALWRAVCSCREDPRRDELTTIMGSLRLQLGNTTPAGVRFGQWLEESYNQADEIREELARVVETRGQYPALALPLAASIRPTLAANEEQDRSKPFTTTKELLEIARSCDAVTLSRVTTLLTHVTVVHGGKKKKVAAEAEESKMEMDAQAETATTTDEEEENDQSAMLPLALDNRDLFQLLPHLLCPGTRFSLRPAVIVATLAVLADVALLKDRAVAFLQESKGKWFNRDQGENFSFGFVRLMTRLPAGLALTDEEQQLFDSLKLVAGFMSNVGSSFEIAVGYRPSHVEARLSDHRVCCQRCRHHRSFTLMVPVDAQVVCVYCFEEMKPGLVQAPAVFTPVDQEVMAKDGNDATTSHLTECRACHTLYSVVRVHALNVEPKCHACRFNGGEGPRITCVSCFNVFANPANLFQQERTEWCCRVCAERGRPVVKELTATFQEIVRNLPEQELQAAFGLRWITADANVRAAILRGQPRSLLSLTEELRVEPTAPSASASASSASASAQPAASGAQPWTFGGKRIHQAEKLVQEMNSRIRTGVAQVEMCFLCCRDLPCAAMHASCGHCNTRSCGDCLKVWYGAVKPGGLVLPANLSCPFCKRAPVAAALKRFNPQACAIRKSTTSATAKLRPDFYYGWCIKCYRVKEYLERRCADGTVPTALANWTCGDCRDVEAARLLDAALPHADQSKPCPGCGFDTIKTSGCNHLKCPVPTCACDWCFQCGEIHSADTIYDHMRDVHGGNGYTY
jgi:hypothetical protein